MGNPLGGRHQCLGVTQVKDDVAPVDLLHYPGDQVALPSSVGSIDLLPLGYSQPLGDHLLGGLGGDPSEIPGLVLPFSDHRALFIKDLRIDLDVPGFGINGDTRLFRGAGGALVGRDQGVGQRVQDCVHRDPAFALQKLEGLHDLIVDFHERTLPFPGLGVACQRKRYEPREWRRTRQPVAHPPPKVHIHGSSPTPNDPGESRFPERRGSLSPLPGRPLSRNAGQSATDAPSPVNSLPGDRTLQIGLGVQEPRKPAGSLSQSVDINPFIGVDYHPHHPGASMAQQLEVVQL